MKILSFDTSTEFCSVALLLGDQVLCREVLAERKHSELILPMIQRLLEESGLLLRQLDGIAFGAGPGSFTGLRIACGVAQGLALGAGLPVMGICTLEALAQEAGGARVIAVLDARMNEIYHSAYTRTRNENEWQQVSEPTLSLPVHAPLIPGGGWTACGSGFFMHEQVLRSRYDGLISHVKNDVTPSARAVAQLAAPRFAKGLGLDPADAAPFYIRNKVAQKESER